MAKKHKDLTKGWTDGLIVLFFAIIASALIAFFGIESWDFVKVLIVGNIVIICLLIIYNHADNLDHKRKKPNPIKRAFVQFKKFLEWGSNWWRF